MAFLTENIGLTLNRTNFDTQSQQVVFTCDATMYPGGPAENIILPLGPDPTILTYYHIVIIEPGKVNGFVFPVTGDELTVVPLNSLAIGFEGVWRVQADPMAYNGGKSFNKQNNVDIVVKRVVA